MPNFFSAVTKYRVTEGRTPKEEQLTEILAEVLRQVPQAAFRLAECWEFATGTSSGAVIRTQRRARDRMRVDVEIRFDAAASSRHLWLELKWGARPDAAQVRNYESFLREISSGGWDRVVLVAPIRALNQWAQDLRSLEPSQQRSWTDLALALAPLVTCPGLTDIQRWLVKEFLIYLEEEGLSAHTGLSVEHLAVMEQYPRTHESFSAVVEGLQGRVEALKHGGGKRARPEVGYSLEWWWACESTRTDPPHQDLEVEGLGMEMWLGPSVEDGVTGTAWMLVVGFRVTSEARPHRMRELCNSRLGAEEQIFEDFEPPPDWEESRGVWFVVRALPLSAIAQLPDIDSQVSQLADFADETWSTLSAEPAPG